jgi:hypothetical protein
MCITLKVYNDKGWWQNIFDFVPLKCHHDCLCHHGQHYTIRYVLICVALPKVAKGSRLVLSLGIFAMQFKN